MRIGFGYDVHRLTDGRKLILGGITIPFDKGLMGHSDADVLIHSICDALFGALALGDIGTHFADSDPAFKDIDSRILLRKCYELVLQRDYLLANLDATICAAAPKLSPYIPDMRKLLAEDLDCKLDMISIKATTEEGMGISGCGEGMSATVVVLIKPKP
ncbi:MAG: 2-C-methyl-D-erythritol 2,4-cyclodiphosphate synthase [Candidatus Cloacimonadaceae bacterium]|jgi:2-C-methyl-D-erythritol 2,4-cyclodiphosphate synthase|nr:2-C-methyl-D-erythritol 2,4-cyclodiphosphate synthase [Candidatus Cloacimonadota bacterium]MDY0127903.1 2-C-methyl-D-erythritol 2,4-cyclodiphosphate synthase [Candidatus Cloacimonadaceae bacterium]MCB5255794.1 2-C-methyl-D-erythritol 2,4-cyclodiphosphate synthase [Candidatus Cloacimonadota bacterium]MCK9178315.1 2-C-methyl-D-erythritol 2,4-cyclodiphosphate synthase [Candidatus Cloacimonadota bacterium]MCK9243036.1 2-C-methyl-D-erythritol 2,4-cyclodiphosphate synthase [Candidatus Cloacimonado